MTVTVADEGPVLRASVRLDGCSPAQAMAGFTDAGLLARWWGGELTAELWPTGRYEIWFPKIPARMTGRVVSYTPDSTLAFGWRWEHEPDAPARTVTVCVGELTGTNAAGAVLTVEHGPYGEGEAELAARAEHREGWEFFLPRLAGALTAGIG